MNDYYEVRIYMKPSSEDASDFMAASLGDIGYESFIPDAEGLTAYVKAEHYSPDALRTALDEFPMDVELSCEAKFIEGQDWNAEWEKNYFQPIVVDDMCIIHSSFHTDYPKLPIDITIDPKMAFGTGHHATTSQMIHGLLNINLAGKTVIDMGTGTGILALVAAMRGAENITAVEIDPMAHENAVENVKANGHSEIDVRLGDATVLDGLKPADIFLANINRNIITADIAAYSAATKPEGIMLLSGFYESDIPMIAEAAKPYGLEISGHTTEGDDKWACLRLIKTTKS